MEATSRPNPNSGANFRTPMAPTNYPAGNSYMMPNPNYDPRQLKRKEINDVVNYHRQNLNSSRDLKLVPQDVNIMSLDVDERIYIYMRRHWTENISWVIRNFVYAILPLVVFPIFQALKIENIEFISFKEIFIILVLYYSIIVTNVVKDFFDWYFDPYIITNERIIHYEFKPFSKYTVQETMLQSVQKIEEKAAGILSNIFGYGTLMIFIEGPNEQIVFKNVPQPTRVRNMISDLVKIAKKYESS